MRKNHHNQHGFSVVEVLLIIIIASGISLVGWFVVQIHHASQPTAVTATAR